MKKTLFYAALFAVAAFMSACTKDDDKTDTPQNDTPQTDVFDAYLINEGAMGGNNASLSGFNTSNGTIANDLFYKQNNRLLGDLAQDVIIYGGKMYISVSGSGTVEVLDPATGKAIGQIDMGDRYPRYLASDGGKVYVSCYTPHSVVRIDTASLQIEATCQLTGFNPEELCVCGDNLYVCNGYEKDANGAYAYDNTLSVVNLSSFTETGKIEVGVNPNKIRKLSDGQLAVCYWGDYGENFSGIAVVNVPSGDVNSLPFAVIGIDTYQGNIYTFSYDYMEMRGSFHKIDGTTLAATPLLGDAAAAIATPYAININPANGDIYVGDAQDYASNGDLYCFGQDGSRKWKAETGILPSRIAFAK